jgi:hypothetical protein
MPELARRLGRTESEMVGLEMAARWAPVSEAQFREVQQQAIDRMLESLHDSMTTLCGSWSYSLSTDDEETLKLAFDMIRVAVKDAAVVRDSLAAMELAIIRHALDGASNQPLQRFLGACLASPPTVDQQSKQE